MEAVFSSETCVGVTRLYAITTEIKQFNLSSLLQPNNLDQHCLEAPLSAVNEHIAMQSTLPV
jgi:hypothetical protein